MEQHSELLLRMENSHGRLFDPGRPNAMRRLKIKVDSMISKTAFYRRIVSSAMAILILISSTYSRANEIQFERISIESGLSQSSVLSILQDHRGFLWFGTYQGLNRYDGYNFKIYKTDPDDPNTISSNSILCLMEDHLGEIWIGTEDGLNRFDRKKEQFISYKNDPNDANSLSNNFVRYIFEDRSGVLWIATYGGGLDQFDREKETFIRYRHDPDDPKSLDDDLVLAILEDSRGNLWIGTNAGLNLFDREKKEFIQNQGGIGDPYGMIRNGVWRIHEDKAGILWFGTWRGGLIRYDPKTKNFRQYRNNPADPNSLSDNIVRSICEDSQGNLWVGTNKGGVDILDPYSVGKTKDQFFHCQNDRINPRSLSSNSILSLLRDRSGIVWVGTDFGGINKYDPGKKKFRHYRNLLNDPHSLNNNLVTAIYEDSQGIIWLGTNGGGLNRFDRKRNQFKHYVHDPLDSASLSDNIVRSICEDKFNRLWIGTDNGLNRFDPVHKNFVIYRSSPDDPTTLVNNDVWTLYKDKAGNLWIGTVVGLCRFDYEKEQFIRYLHNDYHPESLSDNFIWAICEDSEGMIWIGTNSGGLNHFDPVKGTFIHYKAMREDTGSLSNNKVLSIHKDHTGTLWFGTVNGLNKWNRDTQTFSHYSVQDGLPSNTIQAMLEDDHGNLWIATHNGLSRFDPRSENFRNYFESNGLQSNEFDVNACCKLKSGEMLFGGVNGFNLFHPDSIKIDLNIPDVVITNFQIYNKPVRIGEGKDGRTILKQAISETDEITLSYKDNFFSLEFAALHYAAPKDNLYAYLMEGFEKGWNYIGADRRFVTYTNLPSGKYTFRVKAANNDGLWNEKGASLRITITPPFWQTVGFRGFAILTGIFVIITIYQARTRAIRKRNKKLEERVAERTAKLQKEIIEHKRTEQEKDMLAQAIKSTSECVSITDMDNIIIFVNNAFLKTYGYSKREVLGKHISILRAEQDNFETLQKDIIETTMNKRVWQGELMNRRKDGSTFPILLSTSLVRDKTGKPSTLIGVAKDITERKRIESQIKESLNEKEVLLKEIHHRVKNNMQVISSLLNLQSGYIKDEQTRELFKESQDRVRSMALIHEKLYQSADLARVDFAEYIRNLTEYLFNSYGANSAKVAIKTDVDSVSLGINAAIPCGLIINELVSNALKHAFPENRGGEICIDLRRRDGTFELVVSDDGVGFPNDVDFRNTESLGLQLVNTLTSQLGGTIELEANGSGTRFVIGFAEDQ
jgi:PAS domain S-box-containing protein